MSSPAFEAQVAAAKAYEGLFVPALFGQWASRVVDTAELVEGQSVLDVACGTGVLARKAQLRTGPTGYVAGLDPSPGMLAVAKELSPSVDLRQGVAESMPFPKLLSTRSSANLASCSWIGTRRRERCSAF